MGQTATIIAIGFTIVCGLAIAFMVGIALTNVGRRAPREVDSHKLGEREKTWFAIVGALLVALLFATIFFTPYGKSAPKGAQVLNIQAVQFAWLGTTTPIHAGRAVEFRLTSKDVNHAFAVYGPDGTFIFQVQVIPGKTATYVHTFTKPGRYHVLCFEYCGLDHADMQGDLTVVA